MNGFYHLQSTTDLLTTYRGLILEVMTPKGVQQVNETQTYLQAVMLELDARGIDFSTEYLNIAAERGWK
jgi:uncharacterized protein with GYD domain